MAEKELPQEQEGELPGVLKASLIALIVELEVPSASPEPEPARDLARVAALEAELQTLSGRKLIRRAEDGGAEDAALDAVEDLGAAEKVAALIALVVELEMPLHVAQDQAALGRGRFVLSEADMSSTTYKPMADFVARHHLILDP